jgi:hypothetical protein
MKWMSSMLHADMHQKLEAIEKTAPARQQAETLPAPGPAPEFLENL